MRRVSAKHQRSLRLFNFAHITMMNISHLSIIPGDSHRVPTRSGNLSAVGRIAPPANPAADFEALDSVAVINFAFLWFPETLSFTMISATRSSSKLR